MLGDYRISVWLMFFYVYCFFGWCFETTYVSVFCAHRFVNRGFLFGPMLPLYGSGALVILISTLPVKDNIWLTALVGMAASTALEYVTGAAMEAIFKVRYWDYSKHRFNFQGRICLQSSLAWGVLSALLVNVIHRPVEEFVLMIDPRARHLIVLLVSVLFSADATHSITAAIDLRRLLVWLDGARGEMQKLQERIETVEGLLAERRDQLHEDLKARQEQISEDRRLRLERLQDELADLKARRDMLRGWLAERFSPDKRRLLRGNPDALSRRYQDALEHLKEKLAVRK